MLNFIFSLLILFPTSTEANPPSKIPSLQIEKPDGWFDNSNLSVIANLEKYEMEESQVRDLINTNQGSLTTNIYTKYDRSTYPGIIPTIQVNIRPNPNKEFRYFKTSMEKSLGAMGKMLSNFEIINELQEIEIDGRKGIYFLASFEMKLPNGQIEKIRSWTYAIPVGDYFFQVNFSDLLEKDDCQTIYDNLVKTITII